MKTVKALIKRNTVLFFKDKGMFFTSLITPVILLVLYVSFLGNVFYDSFLLTLPEGISVEKGLIDAYVGGQLISSILAVSCVTVAFCSNMVMVQDKATSALRDLTVSPVKPSALALGYYCSTLISTLIICFTTTAVCLAYVASIGWYMSISDVLMILLDVFLLVMFGTALSSVINFFLSSEGQIAAVGSVVSSSYGFVCGAYMPISQFSEGLQRVISFLPGTYGTSLLREHCMRGAFNKMAEEGLATEIIDAVRDAVDCNLYFFDNKVSEGAKLAVLGVTVAVLIGVYVLMNVIRNKRHGVKA